MGVWRFFFRTSGGARWYTSDAFVTLNHGWVTHPIEPKMFELKDDKTLGDPALRSCPHCSDKMLKWYTKPEMSWGTPYQYVCFNDECDYYVRHWEHFQTNYNKRASVRHRYNPFEDSSGPVPVWSDDALRPDIIGDDETIDDFLRRRGSLK